jgi:hypothetical protein
LGLQDRKDQEYQEQRDQVKAEASKEVGVNLKLSSSLNAALEAACRDEELSKSAYIIKALKSTLKADLYYQGL